MMKPSFHPFACSHCSRKPCLRMMREGKNVLTVYRHDVPTNCPLLANGKTPSPLSFSSFVSSRQASGQTVPSQHVELRLPLSQWGAFNLGEMNSQGGSKVSGKGRGSKRGNVSPEEEPMVESAPEEKAALSAPKWQLAASQGQGQPSSDKDEEFQSIQSSPLVHTVWVQCQADGLMPGDQIVFSIFLKGQGGDEDVLLDQISGKLKSEADGDLARAKFFIGDGFKGKPFDPKSDRLFFFARHAPKKLEARSPDLKLEPNEFAVWLELDVDHPNANDDEVVLLDASQAEIKRYKIADIKESKPNRVRLVLGDLPRDQKISLIRDLGPDEEGGKEILFEDLTPKEITDLFGEIA